MSVFFLNELVLFFYQYFEDLWKFIPFTIKLIYAFNHKLAVISSQEWGRIIKAILSYEYSLIIEIIACDDMAFLGENILILKFEFWKTPYAFEINASERLGSFLPSLF